MSQERPLSRAPDTAGPEVRRAFLDLQRAVKALGGSGKVPTFRPGYGSSASESTLIVERPAASTGAVDGLGSRIALKIENDAAAFIENAVIEAICDDVSSGSEDATLKFYTVVAGSLVEILKMGNGTVTVTGTVVVSSSVSVDSISEKTGDNGVSIDGVRFLDSFAELSEIVAPTTPGTAKVRLYAKADGKVYIKDDGGTETDLTSTGAADIDGLSDVDTSTSAPALNDVLKWDGTNWVPGTAGDTTEFTFSIDSFSDGISDTLQLIGSGTWKAIGAITFTASYSNAPGGMTAEVDVSGAASAWSSPLSMTPVEGPETNAEAVEYPSSAGGTVTFTLSQSADASTATDSVSFDNTIRYGNSTLTQGNQTEASLEALSEVAGPNESRSQTILNISTTANYLVFAWPSRLSDVQQVRRNSGNGYVTASFHGTRTSVTPDVQAGVTAVDNSAGFSESFDCITATDTGLADGSNDFQILTTSTAINYIRGGGNTESTPGNYTESDIETGLTDPWVSATNDHTQTWSTVTLLSNEHYVIAIPSRLGTPTFYDDDTGFEASFQSPATLSITNDAGFQEDYNIFVSTNPLGPGDFNLRTE